MRAVIYARISSTTDRQSTDRQVIGGWYRGSPCRNEEDLGAVTGRVPECSQGVEAWNERAADSEVV